MTWVNLLDRMRELRHDDMYDLDFIASQEEANEALENAKRFLERMKKLFV